MGERFWSKFQYGKETTRGTAVAATKIYPCKVQQVANDRQPAIVEEDIGIRARGYRNVIHQYLYSSTLQSDHGFFQGLPLLFGCGLKGNVTPSEQTPAQADYLWDFTPSLVTGVTNAPDTITAEFGDDVQAFEVEYAMFERIRLSGQVSQGMDVSPVAVEADFFGRQLTPTTFTGSLSLPSTEPINSKLARFYLDTAWAGIGGTEKTNILRAFDIEILTGNHPKFTGSANKYFNVHGEGMIAFTAQFTFEGNSDADAIFDAQQAGTFQAVRLQINGSQIGTGVNHSLKVDMGGVWESVNPLGGEDRGNNLHTATLIDQYNTTGAKLLQVAVSTNVNAY